MKPTSAATIQSVNWKMCSTEVTFKEIGSYAPVSPDELRERKESAKEGKRQFEHQHPGTFRPEEYMTEEESNPEALLNL